MPRIRLVPMTGTEFSAYRALAVAEYAQKHVHGGVWDPGDAPSLAEKTFGTLLPEGVRSKGQFLFTLEDGALAARVGMIWFRAGDDGTAFIYDIRIEAGHRRRGYALEALQAAEAHARGVGLRRIALSVHADNHAARALYEKAGYAVLTMNLLKPLGNAP